MKTKPLFLVTVCLMLIFFMQTTYAQDEVTTQDEVLTSDEVTTQDEATTSAAVSTCKQTDIEVKEIDAQKALVIKADVPTSAIGEKMGELYGKLFAYIGEKGIQPAGPVFAIYYSYEPEGNVVFKAGVPVASEVEGTGDIIYKEFPAMKAVTTLYTGSYKDIGPVYTEIQKYMEKNELESTGNSWEVYLTNPSEVADPNDNKTLIYFPVK